MFELFSDIFACRDNILSRMDPRPKLVIAVTLILVVVRSSTVALPCSVLACCGAAMTALRIPPRLVALRLTGPFGIVVVLILLQTFMTGTTELFALSVGGWNLSASEEGLMRGILIGSRVLGAVGVILLLSSVTPAYKIFQALRWFRVPEGWVEIALLVYRYAFALIEQASEVATAQRVRLGYVGFRRSLTSVGVLAGTVITRAADQAMRTYEAMTLRGYQGKIPFDSLNPLSIAEWRIMCVVPILLAGAHFLIERLSG
jgi:cobalt/nickel transport system permease protein